jgi:hypothetical protein
MDKILQIRLGFFNRNRYRHCSLHGFVSFVVNLRLLYHKWPWTQPIGRPAPSGQDKRIKDLID